MRRPVEERLGHRQLDHQALTVIGAQAIAVAILFRQPQPVEHLVGQGEVQHRPFLAPFRPGILGHRLGGCGRTRGGQAEPEGFVQLVAVDAERQRAAEIGGGQQPPDFGIGGVVQVEVQRGVGAVEGEVEMQVVIAAIAVFQNHRQLGQVDMALLHVELAGHGAQVHDFGVVGQRHHHAVDIGQLVARGIDRVIIGVALHRPDR